MSKNWRFIPFRHVAFLSLCLTATYSSADIQYQDAEVIIERVKQAVTRNLDAYPYQNLEIMVRSLDKRLRLKECDQELDAAVTNPSQRLGRVTTEVTCNGTSSWKIYVQATATAELEIPVLVRSLSRGAIIGRQDVELLLIPVGQQQQPIADSIEALVGMELRRSMAPGQPVLISQILAPDVIKRGQTVSIRYDKTDLQITMSGKAMQNGALGDWIAVTNASSGRQIEGRVHKDGSIVIPGR